VGLYDPFCHLVPTQNPPINYKKKKKRKKEKKKEVRPLAFWRQTISPHPIIPSTPNFLAGNPENKARAPHTQRDHGRGTTITAERGWSRWPGGRGLRRVEEEHAVSLRLGHLAPSRMAASHRPLGPDSGPTAPRLQPISRRPQARPRDSHGRGLPQLPHGR
jgi:hypothetical protein